MQDARFPFVVLDRGPGWLAVDKPAGLSVHNDPGADLISLAHAALKGSHELREACEWNPSFSPSPAHRLDRETSGAVLLACDRDRATKLGQSFETREVLKVYRAILRGRLASEGGNWTNALTDRAEGREHPAGKRADQKPCQTQFQRLILGEHLSEIEVVLFTGRQHQIRRHAALNGHAVVGDRRYGDRRHCERIQKLFGTDRLMLHAARIELSIPGSGERRIESPLPKEFAVLFGKPL